MSPVQQTRVRDPRSLALALGGVIFGLVLLVVLFVFAIPQLTEQPTVKVNTGSSALQLGNARYKAEVIAADGPILFSDPAGGQHDIWVQHVGDDPLMGWTAFDAHTPGRGRECTLAWDRQAKHFTDPCRGDAVVAADGSGAGLPSYKVEIDRDEQASVKLVTPATTPPSTFEITGSIPTK